MLDMSVFVQGFALSAGLIVAIGAQNVFVLTQGVRGGRPWLVAGICTACDALLIGLGVGGVGGLASGRPGVAGWLGLAGAAFLAVYGARALASAIKGGSLEAEQAAPRTDAVGILMAALLVSLLNPHALLDTLVLIGGLASRLDSGSRLAFGLGAVCASACWFYSLSLGGKMLAPVLRRRSAWRALDVLVCLTMWWLAAGVGRDALGLIAG